MDKYTNGLDFFCIEDISTLFFKSVASWNNVLLRIFNEHPSYFCKDSTGKNYLMTTAVMELAKALHMSHLADLCCFDQNDWWTDRAQEALKNVPGLHPHPPTVVEKTFTPMRLEGREWFFPSRAEHKLGSRSPAIKLSPPSDGGDSEHETPFSPGARMHSRPSALPDTSIRTPKRSFHAIDDSNPSTITLPKPSTLLLKRLAPKHGEKAPQLMIFTPSYDQNSASIHSAPLRLRPIHDRKRRHPFSSKTPPYPSTAVAAVAPWPKTTRDFPSPPIVPSQQPSARLLHSSSACLRPTPIKFTPKQQFLQPFEQLHDTLEQTKILKSTLDDQIRRSATLMQTLPNASTIEGLVRRQVNDSLGSFEDQVEACRLRIVALERRLHTNESAASGSMRDLIKRLDSIEQVVHSKQSA
ncbi:hypothetical protein BDF14DRAFT_1793774 [Spinellus fusiger]|nr:hypothetical protein BDF14DRAFT_1793774 [Spinellus fusiger]